ncbi:hypothetical protein VY88_13005 [Azospirillum thiophilum]|uniref:Uncharacterized protein n=1 Tax=Azospirillum thiophilum TaxID=528244 RepID=A0AAC8ZU77_9PROT|nr:hypothetical protein [Azospirillum thiophilum]ALG71798.1 hypothetical protein AL072_13730 [Azospirillum thiophilum]KJR66794.1 hypothetical protein VY88_13005 [Azospirillum thiophilum]
MAKFRPVRLIAPLLAVALLGLSACADHPAGRPAASGPAPTVTVVPGPSTPRAGADDQSLRLDGDVGPGGSCQAQCERSHNSCMDSVAARNQGGIDRTDSTPFSPTDNCSYQLRQCYQRCTSVR